MPPKIRELIAELERNGFTDRGGKGSHRNGETKNRTTEKKKNCNDKIEAQEKIAKEIAFR